MAVTRILIVEDEPDVLNSWERALRLAGYSVWTASTAAEALKLCDEHMFDIVVIDFFMPSMPGGVLLTRIRKIHPLIRSIFVTGKLDSSSDETAITSDLRQDVNVDKYFHKPLSNVRLKEALKELLASDTEHDWKEVAKSTVEARKSTIKKAKAASKRLGGLRRKR